MLFWASTHRATLSGQFQAQRWCDIWAAALAGFEPIYNAPEIVLARYLYLLTLRRLVLDRGPRQALEGSHKESA